MENKKMIIVASETLAVELHSISEDISDYLKTYKIEKSLPGIPELTGHHVDSILKIQEDINNLIVDVAKTFRYNAFLVEDEPKKKVYSDADLINIAVNYVKHSLGTNDKNIITKFIMHFYPILKTKVTEYLESIGEHDAALLDRLEVLFKASGNTVLNREHLWNIIKL